MTFNAKNLHYEKQEPAFLQRLRAENPSDRQNVSIARPRKPRLETGDDDGPTIVDEQGENVTEQDYQDLLRGKIKEESGSGNLPTATSSGQKMELQEAPPDGVYGKATKMEVRHATTSGPKKRKQIKAVATESEPEPEVATPRNGPSQSDIDKPQAKIKTKKKKVKLSFDDLDT